MAGLITSLLNQLKELGLVREVGIPFAEENKTVYLPFRNIGTGIRNYFYADSQLDGSNCTIRAIEVIDNTVLSVSIGTTPATDMLPAEILAQAYMGFSNSAGEDLAMLPLPVMIKNLNSGKFCFFDMSNHRWGDCYIVLTDTSSISETGSLAVRVWYTKR